MECVVRATRFTNVDTLSIHRDSSSLVLVHGRSNPTGGISGIILFVVHAVVEALVVLVGDVVVGGVLLRRLGARTRLESLPDFIDLVLLVERSVFKVRRGFSHIVVQP